MAGLLDQPSGGLLDWIGTPAGQGLLTAVAAGMAGARRGAPVNTIGAGLLGGLQGYANAQDQQMQAKRYDQQNKLFDAQMQNIQAQADAKKAAQEQARLQQGYLSTVGRVTSPVVGAEPNKFDPMKWLSLGGSVEDAKALSSSGNWGKSAIKDYKEVRNPDGSVSIVGFDEYGNQMNTGATPFKDAKIHDFGGYLGAIDPVSLKTTRLGNKSMTPGEAAVNQRAKDAALAASQAVTYQQDAEGNFVALPTRVQPGSIVRGSPVVAGPGMSPLKGAQKDGKLTESEAKATLYLGQMQSATDTLNKLTTDNKTADPWQVALTGNIGGNILAPESAQQIGQAQNQWSEAYLRQKTGAAATKQEIDLNNRTFFPQVGDSDAVIKQKAAMRAQAERDMTIPAGRGAAKINQSLSAPAIGTVKDGYRFKGGNPAEPANWERI